MPATIVVACDTRELIGLRGRVPWDSREERLHFRALTLGKAVIMGRKTWQSLPKAFRPLPGRTNVVLSHNREFRIGGPMVPQDHLRDALHPDVSGTTALVCESLTAALGAYPDAAVIGGADVYEQAVRDPAVTTIRMSFMKPCVTAGKYDVTAFPLEERAYFPSPSALAEQCFRRGRIENHSEFTDVTWVRQ